MSALSYSSNVDEARVTRLRPPLGRRWWTDAVGVAIWSTQGAVAAQSAKIAVVSGATFADPRTRARRQGQGRPRPP
jgi:uncharacterized protein with FMN-binding domain